MEVLAEKMDENLKIDEEEPKKETNKKIKPSASAPSVASAASAACAAASAPKKATTAKELRDLMYQHYCVGKGKLKKPSANAIKKGKVPPPPCSSLQKANDESTDEMSEDEDEDDDTSSETSKATTTTASESHNKNGAHCNCCYCEVFGPGKNLNFFFLTNEMTNNCNFILKPPRKIMSAHARLSAVIFVLICLNVNK